jgi:hypothetical protein
MDHSNKFEKIVDYLRQCNNEKIFIKRLYFEFFIQDSEKFSESYKEGWHYYFKNIRLTSEDFEDRYRLWIDKKEYYKAWSDADSD